MVVGEDNKVAQYTLTTNGMQGQNWVVEGGLRPGDRVIVLGVDKVRAGMAVRVVPAPLPAPAIAAGA